MFVCLPSISYLRSKKMEKKWLKTEQMLDALKGEPNVECTEGSPVCTLVCTLIVALSLVHTINIYSLFQQPFQCRNDMYCFTVNLNIARLRECYQR